MKFDNKRFSLTLKHTTLLKIGDHQVSVKVDRILVWINILGETSSKTSLVAKSRTFNQNVK